MEYSKLPLELYECGWILCQVYRVGEVGMDLEFTKVHLYIFMKIAKCYYEMGEYAESETFFERAR